MVKSFLRVTSDGDCLVNGPGGSGAAPHSGMELREAGGLWRDEHPPVSATGANRPWQDPTGIKGTINPQLLRTGDGGTQGPAWIPPGGSWGRASPLRARDPQNPRARGRAGQGQTCGHPTGDNILLWGIPMPEEPSPRDRSPGPPGLRGWGSSSPPLPSCSREDSSTLFPAQPRAPCRDVL